MENEIIKLESAPELESVEQSKAEQIKAVFEPMALTLKEFEQRFNDVMLNKEKNGVDYDLTTIAKRLRLDIGAVRVQTEKVRKAAKENVLREGKAIDGVANVLKWGISEKEDKLKQIETYFEDKERERLTKLQSDRVKLLTPYIEDAHERELATMEPDVWEAYLNTKKKDYEDRIAAEEKAEADRLEAEAKEKIRRKRELEIAPLKNYIKEDDKSAEYLTESDINFYSYIDVLTLRKEAADKQAAEDKAAREKLEKEAEEKRKKDEVERLEREKKEKERIAAEEKERKEAEQKAAEKLEKERKEKEEIAAKLKAKEDAERLEAEESERERQLELSKGDAEKVEDLKAELLHLKVKYSFKSEVNKKMYSNVGELIEKTINFINK